MMKIDNIGVFLGTIKSQDNKIKEIDAAGQRILGVLAKGGVGIADLVVATGLEYGILNEVLGELRRTGLIAQNDLKDFVLTKEGTIVAARSAE